MIDEGTLRERFPEIPWDQPVIVRVKVGVEVDRFVCRYCICMENGLRSLLHGIVPFGFFTRVEALDHIEREHHD
jgi:hypothetical protein